MKRLIAALICVTFLFAYIPAAMAGEGAFEDVTEAFSWAAEHIEYFAAAGVIDGIEEGIFAPNELVTREQFAKMLLLTFKMQEYKPQAASFEDVPKSKWSYGYIEGAKDYLNYTARVDGTKSFRPEDYATREEIAAAVVSVLGISVSDSINPDFAAQKFEDYTGVSAEFRELVSLAAEFGIIEGTTDTTFEPKNGITRAAAVVMLSRAAKLTQNSIYNPLGVTVDIVKGSNPSFGSVTFTAPERASLYIGGSNVKTTALGNGLAVYIIDYAFETEGRKEYAVRCTNNVLTSEFKIVITRPVKAPALYLEETPERVYESKYTFIGRADDSFDYNVGIYMNGEYVDYKTLEYQVTLQKGLNTFSFYAQNSAGKRSETITRSIYYEADLPVVKFSSDLPKTVNKSSYVLKGTAAGQNGEAAEVFLNGEKIGGASFEKTLLLKEGDNVFELAARDSLGKETVISFTINFERVIPIIDLDSIPDQTERETVIISGIVKNDPGADVYVNGQKAAGLPFYHEVLLTPGENRIQIQAINPNGESSELIEKLVVFFPAKTVISTNVKNETVKSEAYVITGTVNDINDPSPRIYMNGEYVGTGNFTKTVTLKDGGNAFTFVAINKYGVESEQVVVKLYFDSVSPSIYFKTEPPLVTYSEQIEISGTLLDFNNREDKLYINDMEVNVSVTGDFARTLKLSLGINTITVKAVNKYGKQVVRTFTVEYKLFS